MWLFTVILIIVTRNKKHFELLSQKCLIDLVKSLFIEHVVDRY
jgi:hypothetical protein